MSKTGELLKEQRRDKGITLEQVELDTKIRHRYIQALEEDYIADLPDLFFVLGFVRNYARYLGLDPESTVELYKMEHAIQNRKVDPVSEIVPKHMLRQRKRIKKVTKFKGFNTILVLIVFMVIIFGARYAYLNYFLPESEKSPHTTAEGIPGIDQEVLPVTESAITTSPAVITKPVNSNEIKLILTIPVGNKDKCWLSAKAATTTLFEGTMVAGENKELISTSPIAIHYGNPGVVMVNLNGKDLGIAGAAGKPIRMLYTTEGGVQQ
ncbi:MAG: RodZ domain-containing protein [Clostridia bacterium]